MKELTILGSSTEFCFSDKASTLGSKAEKFIYLRFVMVTLDIL